MLLESASWIAQATSIELMATLMVAVAGIVYRVRLNIHISCDDITPNTLVFSRAKTTKYGVSKKP